MSYNLRIGSEVTGSVAHRSEEGALSYQFYALYDKRCILRRDVLIHAYERFTPGQPGRAGVDGQTFEDIEASGLETWLDELTEELRPEDVSSASRAAGMDTEGRR